MSSNLMRISVDPSMANPRYLQQLLAFDSRVKSQIRSKVNSGGREIANSVVLNQIYFPCPDISEQDRIVAGAAKLDKRIQLEQNLQLKLTLQKKGVMNDLLSGHVRVDTPVPLGAATYV